MKKRIFTVAGLVVLSGLIWGIIYINSLLPIITGYPAKYLCSAIFISNRHPAEVEAAELDFSMIRYVANEIDYREKSVTSRFLWGKSKAVYREGFGSTLLSDTDEAAFRKRVYPATAPAGYDQDTTAWPLGNVITGTGPGDAKPALEVISEKLMNGRFYQGTAYAFMVVHHGIPVAERYRPGFSRKTRFPGWSVAKSFTNAIAAVMVQDGLLDIYQRTDIAAWQLDGRRQITIHDLMQMQSGLRWNEDYGNRSDVTLMLYSSSDFAGFGAAKAPEFPAGTHWYYSSGSTNIVSYLMRKKFKDDASYYAYAPNRLFNRTGMPDAIIETDPSGTLVGSSYLFATARDYARFGLLYLQNGIFNGERILPEGWVAYSTTPAAHSHGAYGAFFWLNRGKRYPSAPRDMFYCNGHDGQRIFIIPSKDLVVVVLGYSPKPDNEMNFNLLLEDVLGAVDGK